MLQVTVTLTFDILTPKSTGIINGSLPSMTRRKVYLGEIILKLMRGQDFANAITWAHKSSVLAISKQFLLNIVSG